MKIGIVASGVYPFDFGGHEIRMHELGRRFAKNNEVNFFVLEKGHVDYPREFKKFKIHPIEAGMDYPALKYGLNSLIFSRKVSKVVKEFDLDILDVLYCSFPVERRGLKVISTVGVFFASFQFRSMFRKIITLPNLLTQIFLTRLRISFSDKVVCLSDQAKKETIEYFKVPSWRIEVIKNGVSESFNSRVEGEELRERLGYTVEDFVVLYTGRLTEEKGVQDLISAFKRIDDSEVKLLIVGEGDYQDKLEKLSRPISDRVKFQGRVNYREMPEYYGGSDLYVLPTHWDIQPLGCLEAMACGTPVIASDVGGVPEIVKDGYNGTLVPPHSPKRVAREILRLRDEGDVYERYVENGTEFASERTWDSIAKKTLDLYKKLIYRD